jgi:uncharacterized cupredoxin-like copper-binding protein
MRYARIRVLSMVTLVALALGAAACGGGGGGTVDVTLQEFEVAPAQTSVEAGEATFNLTNKGPDDPHEFVVIKTDLAPDALPTSADGSVDENGAGIEVIGEVAEFPPGETRTGKFTLEAGKYVLICNVVEEVSGTTESHYKMGMRTAFTVTG